MNEETSKSYFPIYFSEPIKMYPQLRIQTMNFLEKIGHVTLKTVAFSRSCFLNPDENLFPVHHDHGDAQ